MSKTDQHTQTFSLRDDLAEVLREEFESDARVDWDADAADGQAILDLAESLITRGWVVDYPDAELNAPTQRVEWHPGSEGRES